MGFLDGNGGLFGAALANGFLRSWDAAQDRALKRQYMEKQDKRQGMLDDWTLEDRAMKAAQFANADKAQRANLAYAQNPNLALMPSSAYMDNWTKGYGGGADLGAASPEMVLAARKAATPEKAKLTGTLGNLQTLFPTATPNELLGMAVTFEKAGSTNINVGNDKFGKIPAGYVLKRDGQGAFFMEPVEGSPAAREIEDGKKADAVKEQTQGVYADVVTDNIDRALTLIDESEFPTTGFWGTASANIPGTPAHDLQQMVAAIESNVGFDRLQQMRDASKTGGALGQVSERELALLTGALGSLKQSQSEEQFKYNLTRVRDVYNQIVHGQPAPYQPAISKDKKLDPLGIR